MTNKNITELTATTDDGDVVLSVGALAKKRDSKGWSRNRFAGISATLTGAANSLTNAHEGCLVQISHTAATTLTIPPDSTLTTWPVGGQCTLVRSGAGAVTIAAGAGVTLQSFSRSKITTTGYSAQLIKTAANSWLLIGQTAA